MHYQNSARKSNVFAKTRTIGLEEHDKSWGLRPLVIHWVYNRVIGLIVIFGDGKPGKGQVKVELGRLQKMRSLTTPRQLLHLVVGTNALKAVFRLWDTINANRTTQHSDIFATPEDKHISLMQSDIIKTTLSIYHYLNNPKQNY